MLRAVVQQQLLSHYLRQGRKVIKNNKINLFGKGISIIDTVPMNSIQLSSVLELDLSHNSIQRIEDIQQFFNLEVLNLAHNQISELSQISKLATLKRLRTLAVKKNPFLNNKIPTQILRFLLSIELDVSLMGQDVEKKINQVEKMHIQLQCYQDYHKKIFMHRELLKLRKVEDSFVNPMVSMFPKIKKIFQNCFEKDLNMRKDLISKISSDLFIDQNLLIGSFNKTISIVKERKSYIVKKIYDEEDLLKQQRVNYTIKPRKIDYRSAKSKQESPSSRVFKQANREVNLKMLNVVNSMKKSQILNDKSFQETESFIRELDFQQQFLSMLIKMNPLFHLLHSPLRSLKGHQKESLIDALLSSLKEKVWETIKMQSMKQEYRQLKNDFTDLQQHLQWLTQEVKREQQEKQNIIKNLQKECEEEAFKVEFLRAEILNYQKEKDELHIYKHTLNKIHEEKETTQQERQRQETNEQIIMIRKQKRSKENILKVLKKKAYHLNQIKLLKAINEKTIAHQLKAVMFQELKINMGIKKKQKCLQYFLLRNSRKELTKYLKAQLQFEKQIKQLKRVLRHQYALKCFTRMKSKVEKQRRNTFLIESFQQRRNRRTKQYSFQVLKQRHSIQNERIIQEKLVYYQSKLTSRKHFRLWLKFVKVHKKKQSELGRWFQLKKKQEALKLFIERGGSDLNFLIHIDSLQDFLVKFRKINSYLKLTKLLGTVLLDRQIKMTKIQRTKQHFYFQRFLLVMRDKFVRKKINLQVAMYQEQRKRKVQEKHDQIQRTNRMRRMQYFKEKILKISLLISKKMIRREYQSVKYFKQRHQKAARLFYNNLRSFYAHKIKEDPKYLKLKSKRMHLFFSKLRINEAHLKSRAQVIGAKTLALSFYRWKSFSFWSKMQIFRAKFQELQPQIAQITAVQAQLNQQRSILLQKLQEKELIIERYIEKCQEYEYTLHSKDVKYEKLKDIYADTVQINDLNNTIKECNKATQQSARYRQSSRDPQIYKKYLPFGFQDHEQKTPSKREASFLATFRKF